MAEPDRPGSPSPLVSILTPVYNEAAYLAECIDSVLAQTYRNWEYTIVDNCSTDDSQTIALTYAAQDRRIRVVRNVRFLNIIQNHNHMIRQMSSESKYCKIVYADDWLYPNCVEELVRIGEQNAAIGLVSAYTTDGSAVLNVSPTCGGASRQGLPRPACWTHGRDLGRHVLLGGKYVLGTMTSLLVRSDLVRKRTMFFREPHLHSDLEACLDILAESDFGFAQQALSFSRPREKSTSYVADNYETFILVGLVIVLRYGPVFLDASEYRERLKVVRWRYYRMLAHNLLRVRRRPFWQYHHDTMAAYDYRISSWMVVGALIVELAVHLLHPFDVLRRGRRWWYRELAGGSEFHDSMS